MKQNKYFLLLFFIFLIVQNSTVFSQELKPMAPSMDIQASKLEPPENTTSTISTPDTQMDKQQQPNQPENLNSTMENTDKIDNNTNTSITTNTNNEITVNTNQTPINITTDANNTTLTPENIDITTVNTNSTQDSLPNEINPDDKILTSNPLKEINNDINSLNNDLNDLNKKIESNLNISNPPAENTINENKTTQEPSSTDINNSSSQESITITKPDNQTNTSPDIKVKVSKHDTEIQKEADDIELELRQEEPIVLKDLRSLWSAAVEKSATIRLAIQKLSNPEDEKKDANMVSKVLSPLASLAPLAAMASSSTTQTAGALLGGGLLGTLSSPEDSEYNKALSRISDYDLIMLAKAVDELQTKLIMSYYEYKQSLERLKMAEEALNNARNLFNKANKSNNIGASTASEAFYKESQQEFNKARQNMYSARTSLEQLVGNPAIVFMETSSEEEKTEFEKANKPEPEKKVENVVKTKEKPKEKTAPRTNTKQPANSKTPATNKKPAKQAEKPKAKAKR